MITDKIFLSCREREEPIRILTSITLILFGTKSPVKMIEREISERVIIFAIGLAGIITIARVNPTVVGFLLIGNTTVLRK